MIDYEYAQLIEKLTESEKEVLYRRYRHSYRLGLDTGYRLGTYDMYSFGKVMESLDAFRLVSDHADKIRDWANKSTQHIENLPLRETLDDEGPHPYIEQWQYARRQEAEHQWYEQEEKWLMDMYRKSPQRDMPGYIYVIGMGAHSGIVKIGRATDTKRRFNEISPKLPFPLIVVHLIPAKDSFLLESVLHKYFACYRLEGEWFRLTMDEIDLIKWVHWDQF